MDEMAIVATKTRHTASRMTAECPRCGYDLRGVIESWDGTCPIEGRCAECGLAFEWGELLCERRAVPRWCIEFAHTSRVWSAAFKTLFILFARPRKFWCELKMTHEPRWGRIGLEFIIVFALGYAVFAATVGYETYAWYRNVPAGFVGPVQYPALSGLYATAYPFSDWSVTFRQGPSWYSVPSPRTIARDFRFSEIIWNARVAARTNSFAFPWGLDVIYWVRHQVLLVHGAMLVLLSPLAFLALPQSLRAAKVRVRHIVRIAVYSVVFPVPPLMLLMNLQIGLYHSPFQSLADTNPPLMFLFPAVYLLIWWSLASKHYLKLPHAWGVGVAVVVLGYAFGLFLVALVDYLVI